MALGTCFIDLILQTCFFYFSALMASKWPVRPKVEQLELSVRHQPQPHSFSMQCPNSKFQDKRIKLAQLGQGPHLSLSSGQQGKIIEPNISSPWVGVTGSYCIRGCVLKRFPKRICCTSFVPSLLRKKLKPRKLRLIGHPDAVYTVLNSDLLDHKACDSY